MTHVHPHAHADTRRRAQDKRRLVAVLALTAGFTVVELVVGLLVGSLALLADAGHMLSDAGSLVVALAAVRLAERPATAQRSFGWKRAEVLAALLNGLALAGISVWIFVEAARRLSDPPELTGGWLIAVAAAGAAVNLAGAAILSGGRRESLNVSAAFRHALGDLLGSVGVLVAGVVILTTGWAYIDPLVSILIGLLVLASSWGVLRQSLTVLLEATPAGVDASAIGRAMAAGEGVVEVHDLHVWEITSGFPALSAHVLVGREEDCHARRRDLERLLRERFEIVHTTLQVDHAEAEQGLLQIEGTSDSSGDGRG